MPIRQTRPEDLPDLVRLVTLGDTTPAKTVEALLKPYQLLVFYEDGGPVGFAGAFDEGEGDCNLRLYVAPAFRGRGIGRELYAAGMEQLAQVRGGGGPARVTARYRRDASAPGPVDARTFYARRGFEVWYSIDELIYRGPAPTATLSPGVEIRPFDDMYYFDYIRVVGDAFEKMRRGHDFRPHNVFILNTAPDVRQERWNIRDNIFFLFEGGRLVGEAVVDGDFVDEIGVAPAYQGGGYGKTLTLYCLGLLQARDYPNPRTSVVADNEPARSLYYNLGFELVQTNEWASLRLTPDP